MVKIKNCLAVICMLLKNKPYLSFNLDFFFGDLF